ncbi:MAG: type II toxin-antitoxin system death-on-curing family toxin [Myxococcota bacterium]
MAVVFLTLDEVLALHADQIDRYGGRPGIRDLGLLSSAVATPQASYEKTFLHQTLNEMAAAYLFHLVQNHPFIDGNERTGLIAAIAFLGLNDVSLTADPDALHRVVVGVASGSVTKAEVAVFLQQNTRAA